MRRKLHCYLGQAVFVNFESRHSILSIVPINFLVTDGVPLLAVPVRINRWLIPGLLQAVEDDGRLSVRVQYYRATDAIVQSTPSRPLRTKCSIRRR